MSKIAGAIAVEYREQAEVYRALNNPVRLAVLEILRGGEQCVCHMEAILRLRQAAISQHLMILREAGLVEDRRDGWNIFYHTTNRGVYRVMDAMRALSGQPKRRVTVLRAASDCPCPKCKA